MIRQKKDYQWITDLDKAALWWSHDQAIQTYLDMTIPRQIVQEPRWHLQTSPPWSKVCTRVGIHSHSKINNGVKSAPLPCFLLSKTDIIWESMMISTADSKIGSKNMGVSKNNGILKLSILIGFSIINHPFWGAFPLFLETPISPQVVLW